MAPITFDEAYCEALRARRGEIMERIERAASEAGRDTSQIRVMAVSKTVDVDAVAAARAAGYTCFGENRPQELERKLSLLAGDPAFEGVEFHMIGNLQTNKINHVLECRPALVHSIASLELARAVATRAEVHQMVQRVLLEVNVSGEESKSGMTPEEALAVFEQASSLKGIEVCGLMTMAPRADAPVARATFEGLAALASELEEKGMAGKPLELSMGMSEDFELAVRAGSTIVRLGRVAFDPSFPLA